MKISGFSMGKSAHKLYYPLKQAIMSVLPIVDEFVVALGDSDEDDKTKEEIEKIGSNKVKIIDTVWEIEKYPRGTVHAYQTDVAKEHCTGDWLLYLQSDEVIHEKYLPVIRKRCEELMDDKEVEGLLFNYIHFWGDYEHYQDSHCWYRKEIRIIRNDPDIHSWESAQSFRRIPHFDGIHYRQQKNTYKIKVANVDAYIYHYGWVRPPELMRNKIKAFNINHRGNAKVNEMVKNRQFDHIYDYGNLSKLKKFKGTHPEVMKEWIGGFNWKHQLRYSGPRAQNKMVSKHDRFKYRIVTFIEKYLLFGARLGEFKNYVLLKK